MGTRMTLFFGGLAAVAASTLAPAPAVACSDVESYGRVIGVAKDGRFAHVSSSPVNGCGCLAETFTIHDRDGSVLLRASHDDGNWELAEGPDEALLDLAPTQGEALDRVAWRAIEALGLRPLVASTVPVLATAQDDEHSACLTFEAYARGSGTVIADIGALYLGCATNARASLFFHPNSPLYFVRYVSGQKRTPSDARVCSAYDEDFVWVPRERIHSATLTARAARLADPSGARAGELLEQAVSADATNGRAVIGFVEWLSQATTWAAAKQRLEAVSPTTCLDVTTDDASERLSAARERFAEREGLDDPGFDDWWSALGGALACAADGS